MNPISFRFDLIPFLKEHILPEYKKFLTKEITQSIRFSDLQIYYIELYINFLKVCLSNERNVDCTAFAQFENKLHGIRERKGVTSGTGTPNFIAVQFS